MGRKAVPPEKLAALSDSFRAQPPTASKDFTAAARAVGVDWRTARSFWYIGINGSKPFRDTLAEERTLARASLQAENLRREREAAPALAQADAAATLAREADLSRRAQVAVSAMLGGPLVNLIRKAAQAATSLDELDVRSLTPAERLGFVRSVSAVTRELVSAADQAIALERRRLGDPTDTVRMELTAVPLTASDLEGAKAQLERALARRQAPVVEVIEEAHGRNGSNGVGSH